MKLLIDENLAPGLAADLADLFPGSVHAGSAGLGSTSDEVIWEYAKANGFMLLTKDKDFANLSIAQGAPPKVILIQSGNCATMIIERIVRNNALRFAEFEKNIKRSLLILK